MTRGQGDATAQRRLLDQTRRAIRGHSLWPAGARVLVACSGGGDSTALLGILAALAPSLGHELVVGHVDHGIRAGSQEDGEAVVAQAARLGCPADVARVHVERGAALQARARAARHAALEAMRRQHGCAVIATGHTADDVAETVLMRLTRGAGAAGLGAIRWRRGAFARPLLGAPREALRAWLRAERMTWREDPSNSDQRMTRSRFRANVLPALEAAQPGATAAIARSAHNLAALGDALAWATEAWLAAHAEQTTDALRVERESWPAELPASSALLQAVAERLGAPGPSHAAVAQFHAWLASGAAHQNPCEVSGIRIMQADGALRFQARLVAPPRGAD